MTRGQFSQVGIGLRLREARACAGLGTAEVATSIGVRKRVVERWETGEAAPCLLQFREMMTLYGAPSHEVLFGESLYALTGDQSRELARATAGVSPALKAKLMMMQAYCISSARAQ